MTESIEVIRQLLDVLRRSDPEYAESHGLPPCMDDEWNTAIEAAEDFLDAQASV